MIAAIIFVATYAVVAAGRAPFLRLDRTGAAVVGAILMIATGVIGFDDAVRAVDYRTLALLFGMMVMVTHMRLAGGFASLVRFVSVHVRHPALLLTALIATAGLLSALFVNDTVCLVFTPIVLDVAAARRHRPLPYLLALATASNIGSTATITGNPQNMLIGSVSGVSFRAFTARLGPVALVGLALDAAIIWSIYRRELHEISTDIVDIAPISPHRPLLVKTTLVAAGVLAGFLAGYDTAVVAVAGAGVLLITRRGALQTISSAIDWDLLMLFVGLFVVVGAVERAGLTARLFAGLQPFGIASVAGLSVASALLSNLVSNVPAVLLFTRVVPSLPDPARGWLVLAMATTLAGNLTLLGSVANLIVAEGARRQHAPIGFGEYARVGVPVACATIAFGIWWLR